MQSKNLQADEQLDFFTDRSQSAPGEDAVSDGFDAAVSVARRADDAKPRQPKASGGQKSKANAKASAPSVTKPVASARKQPRKLFLKDSEVAARYSVTRPTVWRWARSRPGFPKPVAIAAGTTRWAISDLEAFERTLKTAAQNSSASGAT